MHRLRDLDRTGRLVALLVLLALAAPFVASVVDAHSLGWRPSGDEALIALRVHDVADGELPLTGQPSTADQYDAGEPPRHPGPIEFYLLTVPVGLLDFDLGMLTGAGLLAFGGVAVAVWVAFRRGGPAVGLGAAVVCSAVAWSEGLAVLTDPISSNVGGIPFLALAALAWALLDGDIRLVPLAAFVFAFVCQAHLAVVGISLGTAAWAGAGIVWSMVAWHRSRHRPLRARGSTEPPVYADEMGSTGSTGSTDQATSGRARPWPWLAAGLGVTLVCWAPVIVDQFFASGNLGRIASFAGSSERPTLGLGSGVTQALRALGLPPLLLHTDLIGTDIKADLTPLATATSLVVIAALVTIIVVRWRSCRTHAWLAATTLVVAVVGAWNGANVPASLEAQRINFYRWTFVVSAGVCASLAWAVAAALASRSTEPVHPALSRARPVLVAGAVVSVAAIAVASIAVGGPRTRRDQQVFALEDQLRDAARRGVEGQRRVLLVARGASATLATGPALALDLVRAGHEVRVMSDQEDGYGPERTLDEGDRVDTVLDLASAPEAIPVGQPGRTLVRTELNAEAREVVRRVSEQVRARRVVRSARAPAILARFGAPPGSAKALLYSIVIDNLASKPEDVLLRNRDVVPLLQAGYLTTPTFAAADLAVLARATYTTSWNDDNFELRELTPAEAEVTYGLDLG